MQNLLSKVTIQVNDKTFLKDPDSSELGKKILAGSIDLIHEIGFEAYTFRKLAERIGSTEASIYRYFESKHKLLLYLVAWYWVWMEYILVFSLANIKSPVERLERSIRLLTGKAKPDNEGFPHLNINKLNQIVIEDSSKAYLTRDVDRENKDGVFLGYKQLVARVSDIILEINSEYKYPHMLITTMIEGAHHQRFFAEHLPRLTDKKKGEDYVYEFYREMVFKSIME